MADEVTLRTAREEDLPRLVEILVAAFDRITVHYELERRYGELGGRTWREWKGKELSDFWARSPGQIVVAELGGEPVGFTSYMLDRARGVGEIGNNGVLAAHRNGGIGARLYARALEIFRAEGMRLAVVTTGLDDDYAPARRAYEKNGFRPLRRMVQYIRELER